MSSKSDYYQERKLNPADELRVLIDSLEGREPRLKSLQAAGAQDLIRDLDQAASLFEQLAETDLDLAPEQSRFATVVAFFKRNAAIILKALGGAEALAELRPSPPPDRERWWWYLNQLVAERRRWQMRRIGIAAGVLFLMILGLVIAFNTILAPSPEAVARLEAENESLAAAGEGDYVRALAALDQGLSVVPDDASLWMIKGVIQELQGDNEQAAQSFEHAQEELANPATFHFGRGQLYYRTGQNKKAEAEARQAIELDDNMASGWLLLGQALESQGNRFESIPAYQKAGEIALDNGESEIVVLARLALGRVGFTP